MKTIAINTNNDIYLNDSNNLALKSNLNAMGDIYVNKCQTVKGELQYTDKGIDFENTIFSSPSYPDLFQNEVITQIEDTEDTQRVTSFEGDTEENTFLYKTKIVTAYGEVALNG